MRPVILSRVDNERKNCSYFCSFNLLVGVSVCLLERLHWNIVGVQEFKRARGIGGGGKDYPGGPLILRVHMNIVGAQEYLGTQEHRWGTGM